MHPDLFRPEYAFLCLAVAALVFLVSTRQWRLWARLSIWLLGTALFTAGAWLIFDETLNPDLHDGLFRAIADAVGGNWGGSSLAVALRGNWTSIGHALTPMFDFFLVLTALLAFLALLAFTPGETLEHIVRPLGTGVVGAIIGAFLALSIVAVGFGGTANRQIFVGLLSDEDVIDGDTIRIGAVSLRLQGVDAPERDQVCIMPNRAHRMCGEDAREAIRDLVRNRIVQCQPPSGRSTWRQAFGRPVVQCLIIDGNARTDIAASLAASGYATASVRAYESMVTRARGRGLGMWTSCTLSPRAWRRRANRVAFERNDYETLQPNLLVSERCPR